MVIKTNSLEETIKLGQKIVPKLKGGTILELQGNLGSGKTTFVKGLALGLGIKKPVRSPTFNLIRTYVVKNNSKIKRLAHIDCYRLKNPQEIIEIGLTDYLKDPFTLTAIEWPQKIRLILKKYRTKKIIFSCIKENSRKIQL